MAGALLVHWVDAAALARAESRDHVLMGEDAPGFDRVRAASGEPVLEPVVDGFADDGVRALCRSESVIVLTDEGLELVLGLGLGSSAPAPTIRSPEGE